MIYRVSSGERRTYFFYLLIMFIVSTAIVAWLFLQDVFKMSFNKTKDEYASIAFVQRDYERKQQEAIPVIDVLTQRIALFNPAVNALYIESDINDSIRLLRTLGAASSDPRAVSFVQTSDIMNEFFLSKKELGNTQRSVEEIKKILERTER
jgi:hypothetical protein